MRAGYAQGLRPDGRELLVVVVKGTFVIPGVGAEAPVLAREQVELVDADVFAGEPGYSAPMYEIDFAPRKPRCDVLLHGSAYAPGGRAVERVTVSLRVGTWAKSFDVVGDRTWQVGALAISASRPVPFVSKPFSYGQAFGGIDRRDGELQVQRWYPANHAGVGYHEDLSAANVHGRPLPNTEESGRVVSSPNGRYRPMALGPIGRAWQPRAGLAGTYDAEWLDDVFPFLPADFQEAYYQAAPPDQQIDYLQGGEEVELTNLTPAGRTRFRLPTWNLPVSFLLRDGGEEVKAPCCDTLVVEPDRGRFTLTWRTQRTLQRNLFEVGQVVVGQPSRAWQHARQSGKTYYPSLQQLAQARRTGSD